MVVVSDKSVWAFYRSDATRAVARDISKTFDRVLTGFNILVFFTNSRVMEFLVSSYFVFPQLWTT